MSDLPQPYPLAWPAGRPRIAAANREADRYAAKRVADALDLLDVEIRRWRAPERAARIVAHELTGDPPLRGREDPADPAAALWFRLGGRDLALGSHGIMVLACDRFRRLAQNIRAIGLTSEDDGAPWRDVLGVMPTAPLAVAEAAYRALAKSTHADIGGSDARMRRLNLAIAAARKELGS